MNAITHNDFTMQWEDPKIMDILMGCLPQVRRFSQDEGIEDEIRQLENMFSSYDAFATNKEVFINEISECIDAIHKKKRSWHGLNLNEVKECVSQHKFCLISGEGGIGKSFFVKCLEESLENEQIPHLCIYGKFEKDTENIDVNEIINNHKNRFVFIVDAINEMSEYGQRELLNLLTELKKYLGIRIVITYRTNAMDENLLVKFKEIAEAKYRFQGVSFESALNELLKLKVPDIYMYEDILFSNNALLLSKLLNVLRSPKLVNETEKGIASITFILERYIKEAASRALNGSNTYRGVDLWEDTKRVARWMYEHGEKSIDEDSLMSVITTGEFYISLMLQMGFLGTYESDSVQYYQFLIDSLTDFLIARSLFADIQGKSIDEQVSIIDNKVESIYGLEEAITIALFDKMSPDYLKIMEILQRCGLIENLQYTTLVKIRFNKSSIDSFLTVFSPIRPRDCLAVMGGFTDKPFNCSNYLFDYYFGSEKKSAELSEVLSEFHSIDKIKKRLKNNLYFITLNDRDDRRDDEAYYFALLCCASPNKDVRCLAMKLLYEIVSNKIEYKSRILMEYDSIDDFYIKESIIQVLSLSHGDGEIKLFFEMLVREEEDLSAKSIKRIAAFLGDQYSYIRWNRINHFTDIEQAIISDYLHKILFRVDLIDKDFLPFRYRWKNQIDMFEKFLKNDKRRIDDFNRNLEEKYYCVRGGECSGSEVFKRIIFCEFKLNAELESLDMGSFMVSYEQIIKRVFSFYNIVESELPTKLYPEIMLNSTYMKCIDIATGLFYGSLMCNYYTDQFSTYNSYQDCIGFEVYDPLKYGEKIVLTSPVPTYQNFVESLGDEVVNSIIIPATRDLEWVRNVELTRENVLALLKPIKQREYEWVMLAGSIFIGNGHKYYEKWADTYSVWCCTSDSETISDDGSARYLTIELDEYADNIRRYSRIEKKPWLCKRVSNIYGQSNVFDLTALVLPPAELIRFFELEYNVSDCSWKSSDGTKVIICNNNQHSYYDDPVESTVFIRKDYLERYLENHTLKYFVFTERRIAETDYADETSLHFEILNGRIEKEILNHGGRTSRTPAFNALCKKCPHSHIRDYI